MCCNYVKSFTETSNQVANQFPTGEKNKTPAGISSLNRLSPRHCQTSHSSFSPLHSHHQYWSILNSLTTVAISILSFDTVDCFYKETSFTVSSLPGFLHNWMAMLSHCLHLFWKYVCCTGQESPPVMKCSACLRQAAFLWGAPVSNCAYSLCFVLH